MKSWELPEELVNDVSGVGRQLVTPFMSTDPKRAPRFALGYLCARLGERLALGQLDSLEGYSSQQDGGVDTYHLRASLSHPALAKLDQALASARAAGHGGPDAGPGRGRSLTPTRRDLRLQFEAIEGAGP